MGAVIGKMETGKSRMVQLPSDFTSESITFSPDFSHLLLTFHVIF